MGSCMSKGGKSKSEAPDTTPYTPTKKKKEDGDEAPKRRSSDEKSKKEKPIPAARDPSRRKVRDEGGAFEVEEKSRGVENDKTSTPKVLPVTEPNINIKVPQTEDSRQLQGQDAESQRPKSKPVPLPRTCTPPGTKKFDQDTPVEIFARDDSKKKRPPPPTSKPPPLTVSEKAMAFDVASPEGHKSSQRSFRTSKSRLPEDADTSSTHVDVIIPNEKNVGGVDPASRPEGELVNKAKANIPSIGRMTPPAPPRDASTKLTGEIGPLKPTNELISQAPSGPTFSSFQPGRKPTVVQESKKIAEVQHEQIKVEVDNQILPEADKNAEVITVKRTQQTYTTSTRPSTFSSFKPTAVVTVSPPTRPTSETITQSGPQQTVQEKQTKVEYQWTSHRTETQTSSQVRRIEDEMQPSLTEDSLNEESTEPIYDVPRSHTISDGVSSSELPDSKITTVEKMYVSPNGKTFTEVKKTEILSSTEQRSEYAFPKFDLIEDIGRTSLLDRQLANQMSPQAEQKQADDLAAGTGIDQAAKTFLHTTQTVVDDVEEKTISPTNSPDTPPPEVHDVHVIVRNKESTPDSISSIESPPLSPLSPLSPLESPSHMSAGACDEVSDETEQQHNNGMENDEPVIMKNWRTEFKGSLCNLERDNTYTLNEHELVANTRTKLLHKIDRWFQGKDDGNETPRAMLIAGDHGTGKTCLAAELCRRYSKRLAAFHFFRYNASNLDHNDPSSVVQWLAYLLCDAFGNYVQVLADQNIISDALANGDVTELWELLIQQPMLSNRLLHDEEKHMLIVIDALDECDAKQREEFLNMLSYFSVNSPDWLYLVATTRKEPRITDNVENVHNVNLGVTNEGLMDIKRILKEPLGGIMDRISLDGGLKQIAQKSGANFLFAQLIKRMIEKEAASGTKLALRQVDSKFPNGLQELLAWSFCDVKNSLSTLNVSESIDSLYNKIVGMLCAAREPLHVDFLSVLFNDDVKEQIIELVREKPGLIIETEPNKLAIFHKAIVNWLTDDQMSGDCSVNITTARESLAALSKSCFKQIIGNQGSGELSQDVKTYVLKHIIYHLTDVPKNQEDVTAVLCSLKFLQERIQEEEIQMIHILYDYRHDHVQMSLSSEENVIFLDSYMKKHPKAMEKIAGYQKFVEQKAEDLSNNPQFLFQIAANYPTVKEIQDIAREHIGQSPWVEDVTAVAESPCKTKFIGGTICAMDMSADGKTLAAVCKDQDYHVTLHIMNTSNLEPKAAPVDIKSLKDRVGLVTKFLPDGNTIFVGSLTSLITSKGKTTTSAFDINSVELKEKYSIEACDISPKFLVCGLTTFPWGGRSVHLAVFDMKTKKCVKTMEVLRFRFGGSAQFGIRSCTVARDKPLIAACVKQSIKQALHVTVWSATKWQILHDIEISDDNITKCQFVSDQTLLLGGSLRSVEAKKSGTDLVPVKSEICNLRDNTKQAQLWNPRDSKSVFHSTKDFTISVNWTSSGGNPTVRTWNSVRVDDDPDTQHRVWGLTEVGEIFSTKSELVVAGTDSLSVYSYADLEVMEQSHGTQGINLSDMTVASLDFLPKSDTLVVVTREGPNDDTFSLSIIEVRDEPLIDSTPFENMIYNDVTGDSTHIQCFGRSSDYCTVSSDGNYIIFNNGTELQVWDRVKDNVRQIPRYSEIEDSTVKPEQPPSIRAVTSSKDNMVAVLYGQLPTRIYLFDLRSNTVLRHVGPRENDHTFAVTDYTILPSNGHIIAYHKEADHLVLIWNARTGQLVSKFNINLFYARISPASDRIAISARDVKSRGQVILRNSDSKFCINVSTDYPWHPSADNSDLLFSADGTILIGVCSETGICRVWNAGNGEVLQDLEVDFTAKADILGMLTNTHVLFHDDRLIVTDIASGKLINVVPVDENIRGKQSSRGLLKSPRGNIIGGASDTGQLQVFRCHNFHTVKRQTTLQRMKSFRK